MIKILFLAYLYSWGGGRYGQLGLGTDIRSPIPKLIEDLHEHEIVSLGTNYGLSAAVTADGQIYTWGNSKVISISILKLNLI